MSRRHFVREQRMTMVNGMLAFVVLSVVLQLWLLTATVNTYLGGDETLILPALGVSAVCFALNVGLLRYLFRLG